MWCVLLFSSCRVGEALHLGPWGIGAINPTGLASKADIVVQQVPGIFAVSETHLTNVGAVRFRQELKQQSKDVYFVPGAGAPPKSNSLTSTGGKHTGVGFVSSYPSRGFAGQWPAEVWGHCQSSNRAFLGPQSMDHRRSRVWACFSGSVKRSS